ncbi:hypothetical protein [Sphingosinicella rhizophila]|uniref:Uncharacterized protein n=1 Tax=Sphingosinicella rhizophila TaxID=3050082 RepID=A0ABU3Q8C0_9SPHN|nr:hypothetical protein [Sphingosinicella sp. GR2756]MDT9599651.1 hypothetical protein [Sphingosinicella sp. GR2756]
MSGTSILSRLLCLLLSAALALGATQAAAAVRITFYSKEFGTSFPHAFVVLEGRLDQGGEPIADNYGFTAKSVTPAILMGAVKGEIVSHDKDDYVRKSDKHFTFTISDGEYERVMERVNAWRHAPQPSYDLNRRNCVHFVAEVAAILGMHADTSRLMKKPRSYLEALTRANLQWLQGRSAIFHRD